MIIIQGSPPENEKIRIEKRGAKGMDRDILRFIDGKLGEGKKAALIIIEEQIGSAPGEEGTLMALAEDGESLGTCGGGSVEKVLTGKVLEGMPASKNFRFHYNLADDLGMVCGGETGGYVRYFSTGPDLVIFGAGHCSEALAALTRRMKFNVTVIDDREGYEEKEAFSHVTFRKQTPRQAAEVVTFGPQTYIVVATWGHNLDAEAYRACLGRGYAFLGGLGSRKKARDIKDLLIGEGFDRQEVEALHLPVGIDLSDGTPEEIAVSILAELLLVKNKKELKIKE